MLVRCLIVRGVLVGEVLRGFGDSRIAESDSVKEVEMRKKVVLLTVVLILALALPLLVLAQPGWSDDFDSYSAGTDLSPRKPE